MEKGHVGIVVALLRVGADANNVENAESFGGLTALHLAAEMGHENVVEALLAVGAQAGPRTATETSPLHQAAMNGHTKVVLDAGVGINARDDNGVTPLDFAVYCRQEETAEELWRAGGEQSVMAAMQTEEDTELENNTSRAEGKGMMP